MHAPYRGHRLVPSAAPPLDNITSVTQAYGFRKLRSAYAGPGVKLRRATGGTLDINFLGYTGFTGAPLDLAAAAAFCNATTCWLDTWYSQIGVNHLVQPTAAAQPQFVFNCKDTLPCLRFTSTTQSMATAANITPATGVVSLNVVASIPVRAPGSCILLRQNGTATPNFIQSYFADAWILFGGVSGGLTATAVDNAWHTATGLLNGTPSQVYVDGGAPVQSPAVGSTTAGVLNISLANADGSVCNTGELVVWDNYVLTGPEITALSANQRGFWSF